MLIPTIVWLLNSDLSVFGWWWWYSLFSSIDIIIYCVLFDIQPGKICDGDIIRYWWPYSIPVFIGYYWWPVILRWLIPVMTDIHWYQYRSVFINWRYWWPIHLFIWWPTIPLSVIPIVDYSMVLTVRSNPYIRWYIVYSDIRYWPILFCYSTYLMIPFHWRWWYYIVQLFIVLFYSLMIDPQIIWPTGRYPFLIHLLTDTFDSTRYSIRWFYVHCCWFPTDDTFRALHSPIILMMIRPFILRHSSTTFYGRPTRVSTIHSPTFCSFDIFVLIFILDPLLTVDKSFWFGILTVLSDLTVLVTKSYWPYHRPYRYICSTIPMTSVMIPLLFTLTDDDRYRLFSIRVILHYILFVTTDTIVTFCSTIPAIPTFQKWYDPDSARNPREVFYSVFDYVFGDDYSIFDVQYLFRCCPVFVTDPVLTGDDVILTWWWPKYWPWHSSLLLMTLRCCPDKVPQYLFWPTIDDHTDLSFPIVFHYDKYKSIYITLRDTLILLMTDWPIFGIVDGNSDSCCPIWYHCCWLISIHWWHSWYR